MQCIVLLFDDCPDIWEDAGKILGIKFRLVAEEFPECRQRNRQRSAHDLLDYVARRRADYRAELGLGVTSKDLFVPELNFVFGLASSSLRAAVVSIHRLDREELVAKEVVHELGHVLGLSHCPNPRCVMSFSNCLVDVERKSKNFCKKCARRLN